METIFKNILSSVTILSLFSSGCTRPLKCVKDDCESDVANSSAGAASSQDGQPETPPQPAGAPQAAQAQAEAMIKQLNGLKGQMQLQGMVAELEAKLGEMDQQYVEGLRDQLQAMSGLSAALVAKQAEMGKLLESSSAKKAAAGGKLLETLNAFAADRETQRLGLMKQLEELEVAILDPLTPEGLVAQVQWDGFFAKLDIVREQSVTGEILATRDEMLKAVAATYAADKATLTSLVEAIIQTNLALVEANAPANAARVLSRLIALETELHIASGPGDGELQASLAEQIAKTEQQIKLPLDAVDPKIFPQIVALVTDIKTAEGTIAGLGAGIETINAFGETQMAAIAALKRAFTDLRGTAAILRTKAVESEVNGAVFGESLGTTMVVLESLAGSLDALKSGLAKLPETDLSAGFPAEAAAQLEAGEAKVTAAVLAIRQSLANLGKIAESKAACTQGEASMQGDVPVRDMLCGETITVISAP